MEIKSVKLVYFSPTQTTEKVLKGIAKGIGVNTIHDINLTAPDSSPRSGGENEHDLFVFGAPIYGGRLPALAVRRFAQIKSSGTPAVVVAVYGNRTYDDALLELRDLVRESGFFPVASAAFIGEHSFSGEKTPIAKGRPDQKDLETAGRFGASVAEKLRGIASLDAQPSLNVPGKFPYQQYGTPSHISPVTNADFCTQCETCVDVCPTGTIRLEDEIKTDAEACIACCACVKNCPNGARSMDSPRI